MEDRQPLPGQGQLITQPSGLQPGSTPWSTGLGKLLFGSDDGASDDRRGAIRLIAINGTLRAEAEALLPRLVRAQEPASREEIVAVVAAAMPAWGVSTKHAAEFNVTYASYADALEGMPGWCIEEGIVRWNRQAAMENLKDGGFPPRPPQLYALAYEAKRELLMAAYRCRLALEWVEEHKAPPPEVRKEVGADFKALLGELKAKKGPNPLKDPRPPSISPQQMAARIRQHAEAVRPRSADDEEYVV